ncbi:MAG: diaminopimelate decarboxylase [Magnetococcales bacterium]|nr:diaminopimelate decarboxylase [Magnetococcales bacterium]
MDYFHYLGDRLYCEEVALEEIAATVGTPCYCYSQRTLTRHFQAFKNAFSQTPHLICYSVKANSNLTLLQRLVAQGSGLDIVSGGELERAKRAGCPGERIVFSGVGKSRDEIAAALHYGIRMFNVESLPELYRIDGVAAQFGCRAPIALRVNPDVDAHTHAHMTTGLWHSKFGIPYQQALSLYRQANRLNHIEVVGLDCHIGSQMTTLQPFIEAVHRIVALLPALHQEGISIRYLDVGGGLGIPYENGDQPPTPAQLAEALQAHLPPLTDVELILEPGRAIVGNAGILMARVEYIKQVDDRCFVITDAGMNDLIRPALYNAWHGVLPVVRHFDRTEWLSDVVGPICESGDFFARDRLLPEFQEGELLVIRSTGAYGFSMSSHYNSRVGAAEVLVDGSQFAVVRRRETIEQLLANEL